MAVKTIGIAATTFLGKVCLSSPDHLTTHTHTHARRERQSERERIRDTERESERERRIHS